MQRKSITPSGVGARREQLQRKSITPSGVGARREQDDLQAMPRKSITSCGCGGDTRA